MGVTSLFCKCSSVLRQCSVCFQRIRDSQISNFKFKLHHIQIQKCACSWNKNIKIGGAVKNKVLIKRGKVHFEKILKFIFSGWMKEQLVQCLSSVLELVQASLLVDLLTAFFFVHFSVTWHRHFSLSVWCLIRNLSTTASGAVSGAKYHSVEKKQSSQEWTTTDISTIRHPTNFCAIFIGVNSKQYSTKTNIHYFNIICIHVRHARDVIQKRKIKYLELWLHVKVLIQSLCTQHAFKYKNRLLIMFIYTFFIYKYTYTNVFLKYKDKYSHIVYQTRNTNIFGGYSLAFTKHNNHIINATLTTIAGLFFHFLSSHFSASTVPSFYSQ